MIDLARELLEVTKDGAEAVLATIVEARGEIAFKPGEKCLIRDGRVRSGTIRDEGLLRAILQEASVRLKEARPKTVTFEIPGVEGGVDVFFDVFVPAPRLYVVGAGHIAVPLVKMAKILDFHLTVIDDRLLFANRERFPDADEVLVGDMAENLKGLPITSST
jgi:xanthine dehydrogenase accessory factor